MSPPPLPFVGVDDLGDRPHVIVDGVPRRGTVLTLSHWPSAPSPLEIARDTSTEIALAYLERPQLWARNALAVTADHLDEDGATSLLCLARPDAAANNAMRLAGVAHAGDFEVVRSRDVGQVAWALRRLLDPSTSPLLEGITSRDRATHFPALAYRRALEVLPGLLAAPARYVSWWEEEDAAVEAGAAALRRGQVKIQRFPDLDLALVTAGADLGGSRFDRIGHHGRLPVHPAVLHTSFPEVRVLVNQGDRYCYYDRYESWVRFITRKVALRRDLGPLAARLSDSEPRGVRWEADSPGAIIAVLRPAQGHSDLGRDRVLAIVRDYLNEAPAAWVPTRQGGAYVPTTERVSDPRVRPAAPTSGTSGRGLARWRGRRRGGLSA